MDVDIEKIVKELEDFFEVSAPKIDLTLLNSREEFDQILGRKSEPWQAGLANAKNNKIYAIHPDKLEEITTHKRESHPLRIKHEIAHLFYYKCTKGENRPAWLNEGLAYYLAGQSKWTRLSQDNKLSVTEYFTNFDGRVYGPGEFMVRTLIEKYGKDKLIQLIKKIRKDLTEESFNDLFKDIYGFDFTKDELKKIIE